MSSGYRPQFYYEGVDCDAAHEYPDVEQVKPGQKVHAYLAFFSPQWHVDRVYPGMAFLVREGKRAVGYGTVTKILDLPDSAENMRRKLAATDQQRGLNGTVAGAR